MTYREAEPVHARRFTGTAARNGIRALTWRIGAFASTAARATWIAPAEPPMQDPVTAVYRCRLRLRWPSGKGADLTTEVEIDAVGTKAEALEHLTSYLESEYAQTHGAIPGGEPEVIRFDWEHISGRVVT